MSNPNPIRSKAFYQNGTVPDFTGALCATEGLDPETWYDDDAMQQKVAIGYCLLCPFGPRFGDDSCYEQALVEERADNYMAFGVRGARTAASRQRKLDIEKIRHSMGIEVSDDD